MKKKSLILIGGGGHCKACIDVIEHEGIFDIIGILDAKNKIGQFVLSYPIIGSDDDIPLLVKQGYSFLITLGQIKTARVRKDLYDKLKLANADIATIISPKAIVSKYAKLGEGCIVMHSANINVDTRIGANCIINTGSDIEHDVIIANHCHLSTYAVINGDCILGNEIFVGSGSIISNGISIHDDVTIGAGSVVYKNINEKGIFVGNPLRKL